MQDVMNVNQKEYKIVKLLGHGKVVIPIWQNGKVNFMC